MVARDGNGVGRLLWSSNGWGSGFFIVVTHFDIDWFETCGGFRCRWNVLDELTFTNFFGESRASWCARLLDVSFLELFFVEG